MGRYINDIMIQIQQTAVLAQVVHHAPCIDRRDGGGKAFALHAWDRGSILFKSYTHLNYKNTNLCAWFKFTLIIQKLNKISDVQKQPSQFSEKLAYK